MVFLLRLLSLSLAFILSPSLFGADYGKARSLQVQVAPEMTEQGLTLQVTWPHLQGLGDYRLQVRNSAGESLYEVLSPDLAETDPATGETLLTYIDKAALPGEQKEYRVVSSPINGGQTAYGHALGGYELPFQEERGGLVLLVDNSHRVALSDELTQLERDLEGDGWLVHRFDVSPSGTPPQLKARIVAAHQAHPDINTVFLFGNLAVPYSGNLAPDGHYQHYGAWPSDVYYGDLDSAWNDSRINNTSGNRSATHNVPSDGKFDLSRISNGVEVAVGRVDLSDLPAFAPLTETDLLRNYLNKNHAYRNGLRTVSTRAIVDDNLPGLTEAVAGAARRSFPSLVGRDKVEDVAWSTARTRDYLFGFGAGHGTYTSANGIGSTASTVTNPAQVTFGFFFGSYFGDFDNTNNFLRAQLASPDHGLSACWGARPYWGVYRMSLGGTLGDVMRSVFNERSSSYYSAGLIQQGVHAALLGDPTLRAHVVQPSPGGIKYINGSETTLEWLPSSEPDLIGYHLYRSNDNGVGFTRLTTTPLTTTSYTDPNLASEYMVRAIVMEETPSGSYLNASQGTYFIAAPQALASPVASWRASTFADSGVNQGNAADPDGDGLSNLLEYALGTDPTSAEIFPLTLSLNESTLSYQENVLATDATIVCEMSANLKDWIPTEFNSQSFEALEASVPGTEIREVTLNLTNVPLDRCSFRLRVVLP